MKRITLLLIVIFIALGINAQKTYVLLVGVSNYGIQGANLQNTTKDVKQLKTVLDNQGMIVTTLTSSYATISNIEKKLNAIIQLAKPDDKIIFFFSGHGDTGLMLAYGPENFYYRDLMKILSKAKTKKVFCFVDACMSGSVSPTEYDWANAHKGVTFMMSSRANEYSIENNWVGHGYYTQALLKGLRGMADKNKDRQITLMELFRYVYNDVTARTRNDSQVQHPVLIGPNSSHDIVITKW
ncbi:MAG: caspase family protein [Prevotella sp.]|nr:caspase family protein [Prevotella sp.]